VLAWAAGRSGRGLDELIAQFPRLTEWEAGSSQPTLKQLERFARATSTPVGALLLPEPPEDRLPVPDFRTIRDARVSTPSPNLLETVYLCEQRQEWYHDFARANGQSALEFVGSVGLSTDPSHAAGAMQATLRFEPSVRARYSAWTDALRGLLSRAEDAGVLVMVSGVVGSNTHRKLEVEEFRGFALTDQFAPLVFINGSDTKAAQIFTLAHELAHVWLGESAVSSAGLGERPANNIERWCNQVAAELLVPLRSLREEIIADEPLPDTLARLARLYKVSTLVVLRRLIDVGRLSWDDYRIAFNDELERVQQQRAQASGGDFYNTQPVRVSKRFARAVIADTLEGRTLYRDAFSLLGIRKPATFDELSQRLGVT